MGLAIVLQITLVQISVNMVSHCIYSLIQAYAPSTYFRTEFATMKFDLIFEIVTAGNCYWYACNEGILTF